MPIGEAFRGLVRYPLRTTLALLGLVVGVSAVVGTLGLVAAAKELAIRGITREGGLDVLRIKSPEASWRNGRREVNPKRVRLEPADAARFARTIPGLRVTMPHLEVTLTAKRGAAAIECDVDGGSERTPEVLPIEKDAGRFYSAEECAAGARVAVLSGSLARDLFGADEPIGDDVVLAAQRFTVIGIVHPPPESDGKEPQVLYVPFETALLRLGVKPEDAELVLAAGSPEEVASVEASVDALLPSLRPGIGRASYEVETSLQDLVEVEKEAQMQQTILGGVALLAMLAAGSGILNTLLVGVRERTREIGTRRALGARRGTILRQFLAEALLLAIPGAIAGLLAGVLVARFLGAIFASGLDDPTMLRVTTSPGEVVAAAVVSVAVAALAGVFPALVASRIPPAEALRYE